MKVSFMISISTLTIAWAVCGRKTFFLAAAFPLILLCRFHSALFFFFFDYSLKKNQTSLMGQILLRPSLLSKRWKEKRLEHIVTIQGDFLASELLCFQLLLRSIRTVIFWQVSLVVLSSQKEVALNFDGSFSEKGPHSTLQPLPSSCLQFNEGEPSTTKICMSPDGFWQSFFRVLGPLM